MSNAITAVVGLAEIAAGLVLDYFSFGTLGTGLIVAGSATLFGYAVSLLMNPKKPPLIPIGAAYAGTLEPRRIIFGMMKVSGMYVAPPMTRGPNNDYLELVLALAGHQLTGVGDVYFNQVRIANGDIGPITGTLNDGAVTATVTNNGYNTWAWIRRYLGNQTIPDYILNQNFTAWDNNHIGKDIAYLAASLKYSVTVFATGVPNISLIVFGAAVYDPRLDSTNGGSGSQRFATPSTWTYSTNPALCLAWYLTQPLGLGEAFSRIDWTLVAAAANICDSTVTVPIKVIPGLLNWQNGSNIVSGIGTAFLRDLNNGQFQKVLSNFFPTPYPATTLYVLGPDNVMYAVTAVQTDTQFGITPVFGGTTAYDQVSQWNINSTATTMTQPTYTCNTILDATARYEDNIAQLARAMMGQCIYQGGLWRIYAGAWSGSAFSLAESDLIGGVSIQCSTPRQNHYNAVRGNFINPARNYNPDEFPAILNSSYSTADGETIFTETNFPCCTDLFECQRNAFIVSRVSRDQQVVTADYGMSAYGVKVWETGTVTIAEVGWVGQSVRCIGWKFTPKGSIQLQLQVAFSADWTTPLPAAYALVGANSTGAMSTYLPYPVTGLTAEPIAGGIFFSVTLPTQVLPGTMIQLYEYTASTPFSSAGVVWQGTAAQFSIPKTDQVTRYYWAVTISPMGQQSSPYPATTGVAGAAGLPIQWIATGNCVSTDVGAVKLGGSAAWDSSIYSQQGLTDCHISGKWNSLSDQVMIGLSATPTASPSYLNASYAWQNSAGTYGIYESGTAHTPGGLPAVALSDEVAITYDGSNVNYLLNRVVVRGPISAPGLTLYGFCPFNSPNSGVNSLSFGPGTNLAQIDTAQIGANAASTITSSTSASSVSCGGGVGSGLHNVDIISLTLTTTGDPIEVDAGCTALVGTTSAVTLTTCNLSVYRDGTQVASMIWDPTNSGAISVDTATCPGGLPVTLTITDAPAAGSHTYTLHAQAQAVGSSGTGDLTCINNFIKVREIKR